VNDYRKYGLLRCLAGATLSSIGICWMLTSDDGRSDGGQTKYLQSPDDWRQYDPDLFDILCQAVIEMEERKVRRAEDARLVPGATFYSDFVPDEASGRVGFFAGALERLAQCQLFFLDPDNGIEVPSVPFGARHSSKYVYWRELAAAYAEGHSLIVYQHYPRLQRSTFHTLIAGEVGRRFSRASLHALKASSVVYFLIERPEHTRDFRKALETVKANWRNQIVAEQLLAA